MNYSTMGTMELMEECRKLREEGYDGMYLDKEEFNALSQRLKREEMNMIHGADAFPIDGQRFIQYMGVKFYIVETIEEPEFNHAGDARSYINFNVRGW